MITKEMTLAEVVKEHPNTIGFLNNLHLDYCCGGHDAIEIAILEKGMDVDAFLADLNQAAARPTARKEVHEDIESFQSLKVAEMLDDLEATHHVTERKMMAETEELLNKILIVHYPHHAELLTKLHHLYSGLKADLEEHFAKEERLVFPLMRQHPHPTEAVLADIKALEEEHAGAGDIIKEIYRLTDNFTLPEDACPTFERTYLVMEDLFGDVFLHIFKENSIVFPEYEEQKQDAAGAHAAHEAEDGCSYCGAKKAQDQQQLLYECSNCGTLYCDTCGEGKGCPNCGAPILDSHPIEPMGASSWNPNQG